jgi:hypothetical protein
MWTVRLLCVVALGVCGIGWAGADTGFAPSKAAYPPGLQVTCPGYEPFLALCRNPEVRWANTRVHHANIEGSLPLNFIRSEGKEFVWADGDLRWVLTGLDDSTNRATSENRGYNYGAFPLVHNGAFHLIGGYGFWRNHADWITFMPELGEWEINRVGGGAPDDQSAHACWSTGDTLHWLGLDALSAGEERTTQWRVLDLASKQWSVRGMLELPAGQGWRTVFNLEHFVVLLDGSNGFALVRKSDGWVAIESANQWAVELWEAYHSPGMLSCMGNVLVRTTPEGEVWSWNFEERAESSVFLDYFVPGAPVDSGSRLPVWPVFPLVGVAGAALGVWWARRARPRVASVEPMHSSSPSPSASPVEHWSPALRALLQHPERELLTSELDDLLGIADVSTPETLRARRARTIQAVNAEFELLFGYTLIQREREHADRRKVVYRLAAPPSMVRKLLRDWNASEVSGVPPEERAGQGR